MRKLTLERVLRGLHDSQIIAGIQTLFDGGVRLWLGDATNSIIAETTIERTGRKWAEEDAARWLHETALWQFPDSKYANKHGDSSTSPSGLRQAGPNDGTPADAIPRGAARLH